MKWKITIEMDALEEHEREHYNDCYEACLKGKDMRLFEYMDFTTGDPSPSNEFVARWCAIYLTAYRDALKELARRAE